MHLDTSRKINGVGPIPPSAAGEERDCGQRTMGVSRRRGTGLLLEDDGGAVNDRAVNDLEMKKVSFLSPNPPRRRRNGRRNFPSQNPNPVRRAWAFKTSAACP